MIRIEQLTHDEASRLRSIRLRALRDAPDAFGSTLEESVTRSVEAWMKQLAEMPTFVGVMDGIDVGMVRFMREEVKVDTGWLMSMWVAPEVRRTGVGCALVDAVIKWARSHGIKRLLLDVADNNVPAIALYKMKGFEPNGEATTFPPPREHIREHRRELRLS